MSLTFSEQIDDSYRGVVYATTGEVWYFITATPKDYRLFTLLGPHKFDVCKFYTSEDLDEYILCNLAELDWTFI